jgi:hypothetical protein
VDHRVETFNDLVSEQPPFFKWRPSEQEPGARPTNSWPSERSEKVCISIAKVKRRGEFPAVISSQSPKATAANRKKQRAKACQKRTVCGLDFDDETLKWPFGTF